MGLWKIENRFRSGGVDALRDHKRGRLFEPLSSKFYNLVVEEWKGNKCGERKLYEILKRKGFSVSRRKISQILFMAPHKAFTFFVFSSLQKVFLKIPL